ncbi:MAG: hypothetical protein ACXACY_03135 [Candidatus Hodarchaeales archaeon]
MSDEILPPLDATSLPKTTTTITITTTTTTTTANGYKYGIIVVFFVLNILFMRKRKR